MVVTTVLSFQFLRVVWGWTMLSAAAVLLPLFVLESVFLGANLLKVHDGGYVPVLIAGALMVMMWTWKKGTLLVREKAARSEIPLMPFIASIERKSDHSPVQVPGTAIFLTSLTDMAPGVLLHNLKHNRVLHARNVILNIKTAPRPYVPEAERVTIEKLSERFIKIQLLFGFMEDQDVSRALPLCRKAGFDFEIMSTSFYVGRRKLVGDPNTGLPAWQDRLFIAMAGFAIDPSDYFQLPSNRVVELGEQMVI
jgi:KUP system potassium uptake protein